MIYLYSNVITIIFRANDGDFFQNIIHNTFVKYMPWCLANFIRINPHNYLVEQLDIKSLKPVC